MINTVDIFPWNDNFNTGIGVIDEQHQELVRLLNKLASYLAYQTDLPQLDAVFDALANYAVYHFHAEEAVWRQFLDDDPLESRHRQEHASFVSSLESLRAKHKLESVECIIEDILGFLSRWLASHILENDRYLAMVVLAMQSGLDAGQAKLKAKQELEGTLRLLINIILSTYSSLTTNTLRLMRELAEHRRDAAFLKKLSLAVDQSPSSIIITDLDANIEFVNAAFVETTGYSREEVLGQNPRLLQSGETPEATYVEMWEALTRGETWKGELIDKRKDGSLYTERATIAPVFQADGKVSHYLAIKENITNLKAAELVVKQSEEKFRSIFDYSNDALMFMEGEYFVDGNLRTLEMFNLAALEELKTLTPLDLSPAFQANGEASRTAAKRYIETAYASGFSQFEWLHQRRDGVMFPCEVSLYSFTLQNKLVLLANVRDITERKQAEIEMRIAATAFESQLAMLITDAEKGIVRVNKTFSETTGYEAVELIGANPRVLSSGLHDAGFYTKMWRQIDETGSWEGEVWDRRKDGEIYPVQLTVKAVKDKNNEITNYVATHADISQLKQHQREVEHIAYHDPLTGLPNRRLLADRMQQALAHAKRVSLSVCIVCIDLDGFKEVNDLFGHDAGDRLLIEAGRRMQLCVRSDDTVARLGGDEFVLLLNAIGEQEDYALGLQRILDELTQPFELGDGLRATISGSLGYTLYPQNDADADTLLRHADYAMYVAKQAGKNRFHEFDVDLDNRIKANLGTIERIETALKQQEFCLFIQPKVSLRTGLVAGAEALIRWRHPEHGIIPPMQFLPSIENNDIAVSLGDWVIREGLRLLSEWHRQGLGLPLSVNVCARQLLEGDFASKLTDVLGEFSEIPASLLEIEIVESKALDDIEQVSCLISQCQSHGVSFSLDDFGTGYSSLTYLKRLSVDTLKIDQSFVRDMLHDDSALAIVRGVIGLAQAFNSRTVAEGVESWQHATLLKTLGCELIQGYAIAKPMPAEEFPHWLAQFEMPRLCDG